MIEMLKSKIHRATVTDAALHYEGSITISKEMADSAGIFEYQKVTVVDINNGNRFETYVIIAEEPGIICLNGAAARMVCVGDLVIIMAYEVIDEKLAANHTPVIVHVDADNRIVSSPQK